MLVTHSRFAPFLQSGISWLGCLLAGRRKRLNRRKSSRASIDVEALEDRTLLSGLTIVTHGFQFANEPDLPL